MNRVRNFRGRRSITFPKISQVKMFSDVRTIPGTMEAWLEYKAAAGSFVSMGGASAQLGIVLDTEAMRQGWKQLIADLKVHENLLKCNNQQSVLDFACAVDEAAETFEPKEECPAGGSCVGLFSFLDGVPNKAKGIAGCPEVEVKVGASKFKFHSVGGIDQTQLTFRNHLLMDKYCAANNSPKTCKKDAECSRMLQEFASKDYQMHLIVQFLNTHGTNVQLAKAGSMARVKMEACEAGTYQWTFLWGRAMLQLLGTHRIKDLPPGKKVDWLDSAATVLGYSVRCPFNVPTSVFNADPKCSITTLKGDRAEAAYLDNLSELFRKNFKGSVL
jgi:hypothetical protein